MKTMIRGKDAKWDWRVWYLWRKTAEYYALPDVEGISESNYFMPRPYRNEYDKGSDTEGFTYVWNRKVGQVMVPPALKGAELYRVFFYKEVVKKDGLKTYVKLSSQSFAEGTYDECVKTCEAVNRILGHKPEILDGKESWECFVMREDFRICAMTE